MRHIGGMWSGRVVVAVLAGSLVLGATHAFATPAAPTFESGSGRAEAKYVRAGPSRGALPLTPQLGLALADHLGSRGRGDVRALDLGILADFLPPEVAGAFPVVKVESTQDGAEEGRTESAGTPSEVPAQAGTHELHARAGDDPFGQSSFRGAPVDLGGVVVQDGQAHAFSGVVDGVAREAVGRVHIGRLGLGGGAVVLEDLEWRAVHRTGADAVEQATFSVGAVVVQGERFVLPEGSDQPLRDVIADAEPLLRPLGLHLQLPEPRIEGGIAEISPLRIRVADPEVSQVLAPALEAAQPGRDAVVDAVRGVTEEADAALLVADIALGVVAGGSRLDIDLGGASARTAEPADRFEFAAFDLSAAPASFAPAAGGTSSGRLPSGGTGGAIASPAPTGRMPTAAASGSGAGASTPVDPTVELATGAPTSSDGGVGPMLPIGIATLAAAAWFIAADHRRLRRMPLLR